MESNHQACTWAGFQDLLRTTASYLPCLPVAHNQREGVITAIVRRRLGQSLTPTLLPRNDRSIVAHRLAGVKAGEVRIELTCDALTVRCFAYQPLAIE